MVEHRWQGYSHEELYKSINAGPGPSASHASMERWAGVSAALTEINGDLHAGITGSGASWEGKAADVARAGLNPLATWADDARTGSEVMRISAELQADHISKARSDMPPPVAVTAEQPNALVSGLTHLFGGQTDHEKQEQAADAAENRAREVMSTYASSTTANTSTLGQFHQPPQLVINASGPVRADGPGVMGAAPVFGLGSHGTAGVPARRAGSAAGRGAAVPPARSASGPGSTSTSGSTTRTSGAPAVHTSGGSTSVSSASGGAGSVGTSGAVVPGQAQRKVAKKDQLAPDSTAASSSAAGAVVAGQQAAVAQNSAAPLMGGAGTIGGGSSDTVHKRTVAPAPPAFDPFGGMGARRDEEEEETVHQAADYLRETDDIYGVGSYTLPVIGESTTD
ncbi:PPE domain-containing protein [Lentzea tibetensis]|nr:PPE domain-containing protein [Lentzea tibetensis]